MTQQDFHVLETCMHRFGGRFCEKLADAMCAADPINRQKLFDAFPDIVMKYGPGSNFAKLVSQEAVNV